MTKTEIILILVTVLAATWSGIITFVAIKKVKKAKAKVAYYQTPSTQIEIMRHVIRNQQFTNGAEVFK